MIFKEEHPNIEQQGSIVVVKSQDVMI